MAESGIYEIVNLVNGKRYVGSAAKTSLRWRQHRRFLKRGDHPNIHLQRAWAKHGEVAFVFRVIEICPVERLIEREQAHIDEGADYNICPTAGSTLGRPHSEDTRKKIAARKVGLKMPPRSAEHRASLSKSNAWKGKGPPEHVMRALQEGRSKRVYTDEQRERIAENSRQKWADGTLNRERPPEYREKIAAGLRRHAAAPEVRERLREQARNAWKTKTPEERAAHMEKVRAGRRR